jgi:glyoxylase-like metal-dependent hydrolase (beta-lactamase superfamily II)
MADPKIRIRMYRPGLGDCFLITITRGAKKSHILIDCGRFNGSKFPGVEWSDILGDIKKQCGGKLDAVVVTHEHSDHISGFHDNLEEFRKMAKGELWMAWTEDPKQKIISEKKPLAVLRETAARMGASPNGEVKALGEGVLQILGFSPTTDREFEEIKALWPRSRTKLFDPGDVIERDWLHGVRVHVLGPPKNKKFLNKTKGVEGVEMYLLHGFGAVDGSAAAAAGREMQPFDDSFRWTREQMSLSKQFGGAMKSYASETWRNIDFDWLESVQRMALQYDTSVNNTSLVLAFELPESQKVLLFVGDAQIGNWQSWGEVKYKAAGMATEDLLGRVVFYKCGHHGSHNSTLKLGGLEAMPKKIQVAIPTNEKFALGRKPHPWKMPAKGIGDALKMREDIVKRADDTPNSKPYIDFKF